VKSIRLAIVEDDDDIREVMVDLIGAAEDIVCYHSYQNAEDFLKEIDSLMVDVVLMDITLPGMTGIQCVRQAKAKRSELQFLMCTSHNDASRTFDSLCAGATGYLVKNSSPEEVFNGIRQIHNGGSPMSPEIARIVVSSFPSSNQNEDLLSTFSTREQEILHALAKGGSYQKIADELFISIETVRTYLRKIYKKLQVHSKVEALNKVFPK